MPSCCQVAIVCDIQNLKRQSLKTGTCFSNLRNYKLYYLTITDDSNWYTMASKILKQNGWKHKNQVRSNNGPYNVHVFSLRKK